MAQPPYLLDARRRRIVLEAIKGVCNHNGWNLLATHVRTNHVHVVLDSPRTPERVMNALKSYASRALNEAFMESSETRRWARHGSTRYLWTPEQIAAAIHYVICEQGEAMEVYMESAP